jgi:predicted MFS family arabinose efflux permease
MMKSAGSRAAPTFSYLLVVLLAAQALGTMATSTLPAVVPKVAETYGVSSALIGYQISLLAIAMLVSLTFGGNLSVRWGACRVTQVGIACLIAGSLTAIIPHVAFIFASAIGLGLGYGLITPSASHLLARYTPAQNRNLVFSLKQTGVPLGGVGAALVGPAIAVSVGWQWALLLNAAAMAAILPLLQRGRNEWDNDRDTRVRSTVKPFAGVAGIWRRPALRLLSIAGGCFVIVQICISTFTVVLFAEEMKHGLIQAGCILLASQLGGVFGRVFWGWLSDLTQSCNAVMAVLAAVMSVAALACAVITPDWPIALSCALFFIFGSTASGWNGAFLAEVARLTPHRSISSVTGGSLVYVNIGKMLGPIGFANAYLAGGSYAYAFALLALPAAAGLSCMIAAHHMTVRPVRAS